MLGGRNLIDCPDVKFLAPTVFQRLDEIAVDDLGVAFDGDGDRIGAIDENGDVIWCDRLMILYAMDILKRHPGAPIIGDVKCSQEKITNTESNKDSGLHKLANETRQINCMRANNENL